MTWPNWMAGVPFFKARRALEAAARRESRPPLLVFDHIPKTAGTTFRRSYLTCALPRDERLILSGGEHNESERQRLISMPPDERQRLRIVAGHGAEALRPHLPGARFITLIRDPVDRAISSYLHARFHEGGDDLWAAVRQNGLTLGEFVQQYEPPDAQSRLLLGDDYATLDAEGIGRRLRARYALVGYTEAFAEFIFLLHRNEGLPLCLFNDRLVRAERSEYVPSAADVDLVRRLNEADTRLHRIVREDFHARLDRLNPPERQTLARYLDTLNAFRADTHGDVSQAVRLDDSARAGPSGKYVSSVFGPFAVRHR
jgi:hypothetical protein